MSKKAAQKGAVTRDVIRTETWRSEVYIFGSLGQLLSVEDDGEFVLTFNQTTGVVTGTHSRPTLHNVIVTIVTTGLRSITLLSADNARIHMGALKTINGQDIYVGKRKPLTRQEEGTWVGTKVG